MVSLKKCIKKRCNNKIKESDLFQNITLASGTEKYLGSGMGESSHSAVKPEIIAFIESPYHELRKNIQTKMSS